MTEMQCASSHVTPAPPRSSLIGRWQKGVSTAIKPATRVFERERPRLSGLAYRMLGSVAEAEDVVQDAWLRWDGVDRDAVRDDDLILGDRRLRVEGLEEHAVADHHRASIVRRVNIWIKEDAGAGNPFRLSVVRDALI